MLATFVSGAVAFAFGLSVAIASWSLGIGRLSQPGVGFFSFVAGIGICVLALSLLVDGVAQSRWGSGEALVEPWSWKGPFILLGLWGYVEAMPWLGFPLSTSVLMTLLFRAAGVRTWTGALALGISTGISAEVCFGVLLDMKLPSGVIRF